MADAVRDRPRSDAAAARPAARIGEWWIAAHRLRRNTLSVAGLGILVLWAVIAVAAPAVAPHDPVAVDVTARLRPPGAGHPFGTDFYGRDILSRIVYGARYDLVIGIVAVGIAAGGGTPFGVVAGYYRGYLDDAIMRVCDVLLAFPSLVLALALGAALGPGLWKAVVAVAITSIAGYARLARGSTLVGREETYVEAARAQGASDVRILARYVLPNIVSPIVVRATIGMGFSVLLAASLSFVGLGAQPPTPEWGAMINEGRNQLVTGVWWISTFPGLAIMSVVLGFNLLGDGIRDVLDPRGATRI